jgi:ElaB/YqjD/DUF883 family membrane-anchored ribosome-binding protein
VDRTADVESRAARWHARSDWIRDGLATIDRLVDGVRTREFRDATDSLASEVRKRPLQMLAIAAVTGFVVGSLLNRD